MLDHYVVLKRKTLSTENDASNQLGLYQAFVPISLLGSINISYPITPRIQYLDNVIKNAVSISCSLDGQAFV